MKAVSEDAVEQAPLEWLAADLGWGTAHGRDTSTPYARAPGADRASYHEVALAGRQRKAIARLNPHIPPGARDDALGRVLNPNVPGLVNANRRVHRWQFFCDGGRAKVGSGYEDVGLVVYPPQKARSPGEPTEAVAPTGNPQST